MSVYMEHTLGCNCVTISSERLDDFHNRQVLYAVYHWNQPLA